MVCPQCGVEYRPGFTMCADCDVPLVSSRPDTGPEPEQSTRDSLPDIVTVFSSGDSAAVALARSILDSAGIPFLMQGEPLQYQDSESALPGIVDPAGDRIEFQVGRDDEERARELLGVLLEPMPDQANPGKGETG